MMPLPKSFTAVTTLSKTLAMILFIILPFFGFYLGVQYEKKLTPPSSYSTTSIAEKKPYQTKELCEAEENLPCEYSMCDDIPPGKTPEEICGEKVKKGWYPQSSNEIPPKSWDDTACTQGAKTCPDGSSVGREGPNCEFAKCPGE